MNSRIFDISVLSCPLSNPELGIWANVWRKRPDGSMDFRTYELDTVHRLQRLTEVVQNVSGIHFDVANTGDGDLGWRARRVVIDGEVVG